MLLATKHILTDKSSFPSKRRPGVAGRAGSPPGISEHRKQSPQTICKPFEAEDRGGYIMFWERKGHFQSACCPKPWRRGSRGLSEPQASPGITGSQLLPSREGWAVFLEQRFSCSLLLLQNMGVFAAVFAHGWKHGVETDSECRVSTNTHILLQHLVLNILHRFVLLLRQFRFVVSRMGCGIRFPGLPSWLPWGWRTQQGLQG